MNLAEGQRDREREIEVMCAKYWWYDAKGNKIPWFRPTYEAERERQSLLGLGEFGDVSEDSEPNRHEWRLEEKSPDAIEKMRKTGSRLAHCEFML